MIHLRKIQSSNSKLSIPGLNQFICQITTLFLFIMLMSSSAFADVNVKDFGAVGDGVADDSDAIQNAFNYAQTKIISFTGITPTQTAVACPVYFPHGRYKITRQINLPANFTAVSEGAIIDCSAITSDSAYGFYCQEPYYCRMTGLTFFGGTNAVYLNDSSNYFYLIVNNCRFRGQSNFGIKATSTTSNADIRVSDCEFVGTAKNFVEFNGDSIKMDGISTCAKAVAYNDSASFKVQGRVIGFYSCIFTPAEVQSATQRAWVEIAGGYTASFHDVTFGGETGRRTGVNVTGNLNSLAFYNTNVNASGDTDGQLSGVAISYVRLFGDYLSRLIISGGSGQANLSLVDFATGVSTSMTNMYSLTINNVEWGSTSSLFKNKLNIDSGIYKRPNELDHAVKTSQVRATTSGTVLNRVSSTVMEAYFDIPADYDKDGLTGQPSSGTYLFEFISGINTGGGNAYNVTTGIVGWFQGATQQEVFTNILVNKCDQRFSSATIAVNAIFSNTGTSTQNISTPQGGRYDSPVDGIVLRFTITGADFGGYGTLKIRPLFNNVSY